MRKAGNKAIRNVALFSYRQGTSPMHHAPVLAKFILLSIICFRTFSNDSYFGLTDSIIPLSLLVWWRAAFYFIVQTILFFCAKTPLAALKKMKFIVVIGIPLILLRTIRIENIGVFNDLINYEGFFDSLLYLARFYIASLSAMIVFETTSRLELFDAFYTLENVLVRIVPAAKKLHAAATLSITISFIPEIFSTWNTIIVAAAARTPRRNKNIFLFIQNITAQFAALFYAMIDYAEQLRRAAANRMPQE